jgi:phospholipase C
LARCRNGKWIITVGDARRHIHGHVDYACRRKRIDEASGTSNDDHPHADIRNGEAFLNQVYTAVTNSPAWPNTVLIITFDEWGGFFDHVAPPLGPIPPADAALGSDGRLGFRVPTLVVSPFARRQFVARRAFDHTSVLKLIEWRWGLAPLTVRDAAANNLAAILDFDQANADAPAFSVPPVRLQAHARRDWRLWLQSQPASRMSGLQWGAWQHNTVFKSPSD